LYKLFRSVFLKFFNFHHHTWKKNNSKIFSFFKKKISFA
jgi:hypothetical protein